MIRKAQVVPEILLAKNSEKAKKTWKSLCKKKKSNWNPKDHELFGKLDLWLRWDIRNQDSEYLDR